jgi:hypothetical protein
VTCVDPFLLAPSSYLDDYRPRLVAVDNLSIVESSAGREWQALAELGLTDGVTLVHSDLHDCREGCRRASHRSIWPGHRPRGSRNRRGDRRRPPDPAHRDRKLSRRCDVVRHGWRTYDQMPEPVGAPITGLAAAAFHPSGLRWATRLY